jgi:hypothetical protein
VAPHFLPDGLVIPDLASLRRCDAKPAGELVERGQPDALRQAGFVLAAQRVEHMIVLREHLLRPGPLLDLFVRKRTAACVGGQQFQGELADPGGEQQDDHGKVTFTDGAHAMAPLVA